MLLVYFIAVVIFIAFAIFQSISKGSEKTDGSENKERIDQILVYSVKTLKISSLLILIGGFIGSIYCFNKIEDPLLTILYIIISSIVSASMFYIISKCGEVIINKKLL